MVLPGKEAAPAAAALRAAAAAPGARGPAAATAVTRAPAVAAAVAPAARAPAAEPQATAVAPAPRAPAAAAAERRGHRGRSRQRLRGGHLGRLLPGFRRRQRLRRRHVAGDRVADRSTKVNGVTFQPGNKICLKAGGSWTGQLRPKGSGSSAAPIVIDQYGSGAKPKLAAGTADLDTVYLLNQQYWEINNLDVTNKKIGARRLPRDLHQRAERRHAEPHLHPELLRPRRQRRGQLDRRRRRRQPARHHLPDGLGRLQADGRDRVRRPGRHRHGGQDQVQRRDRREQHRPGLLVRRHHLQAARRHRPLGDPELRDLLDLDAPHQRRRARELPLPAEHHLRLQHDLHDERADRPHRAERHQRRRDERDRALLHRQRHRAEERDLRDEGEGQRRRLERHRHRQGHHEDGDPVQLHPRQRRRDPDLPVLVRRLRHPLQHHPEQQPLSDLPALRRRPRRARSTTTPSTTTRPTRASPTATAPRSTPRTRCGTTSSSRRAATAC